MFRDILCRLSGTNDITLAAGGVPQDIGGATTAGLLSTNGYDISDSGMFLGDGEPLFARCSVNSEDLDSATANATIDIEIVALPAGKSSIATFTFTAATTDIITATAHGLVDGTRVTVATTTTLPAGLAASTNYYVIEATTDTFKLSATPGGAAVDITSTGSGTHTATWYPVTVSCMKGVPLERMLDGQHVDIPIGAQPFGNGVGIPSMGVLYGRFMPSANLTAGMVFLDIIRGRSTTPAFGSSGFTMSNP